RSRNAGRCRGRRVSPLLGLLRAEPYPPRHSEISGPRTRSRPPVCGKSSTRPWDPNARRPRVIPRYAPSSLSLEVRSARGDGTNALPIVTRGVKQGTRGPTQVRPTKGVCDNRRHVRFADVMSTPGSSSNGGCGEKHGGGRQEIRKTIDPRWESSSFEVVIL